jgi:hypothetical protein
MMRSVSRWEDTIKMDTEERAGNLRTEFIGLRMGTPDSPVSLILNPLTPLKAKNFLIALTNISIGVITLMHGVRLYGVCYIFSVWKYETAETCA